jgi:hypothetical protein
MIDWMRSPDIPNIDGFGDSRVVTKRTIIDLKSTFGLSALRDFTDTVGSGSITNAVGGPEYTLGVGAANDIATLRSVQRGEYVSGYSAEAGMGIRLSTANYSSGQVARWGYMDNDDGFCFQYDDQGLAVCVYRAGVQQTIVRMADFNADKLDGFGPSREVFQINYTWYGYGTINFVVVAASPFTDGIQRAQIVHRFVPTGQTSTRNPNLPISVVLENGPSTSQATQVHVAGRQYSLFGDARGSLNERLTSTYRLNFGFNSNAGFVPAISVRRKTGYLGNPINVSSFNVLPDANVLYQLRVNSTLTGASFGPIPDTVQSETALEVDNSASSMTGGVVFSGLAHASAKGGVYTKEFDFHLLEEDEVVALCVHAYVQDVMSGAADVPSVVVRCVEEW